MIFNTRIIRSLSFSAAFMASALAALADNKLYINGESLYIEPGSSKTVELMLDNDDAITALQFRVNLPEGLSITQWNKNTDRLSEDNFDVMYSNGVVTILTSTLEAIAGNSGSIGSITITAASDFTEGDISFTVLSSSQGDNDEAADITTSTTQFTTALSATASFAATATEVETRVGDECELGLNVNFTSPAYGIYCKVELPEGLSLVDDSFAYSDRVPSGMNRNMRVNGNTIIVNIANKPTGTMLTIEDGDDPLFTFRLKAGENLAETSKVVFSNLDVTISGNGDLATIEGPQVQEVTIINTTDSEAEAARQAANEAAAVADMAIIETLQAELTEAIKGNEGFLTAEDNKAIEEFMGEKYSVMVNEAFEKVDKAGEYSSPINEQEMRAIVDGIKDNIEAAKAAEDARQAANEAAAVADMELIETLQAELTEAIKGNEDFLTAEDNKAIEEFMGEKYSVMVNEAFEKVDKAGEYSSPINEQEMRAIVDGIKDNIEAGKKTEENRAKANILAAEEDKELLKTLQSEWDAAIKGLEAYLTDDAKAFGAQLTGEKYSKAIDEALEAVKAAGKYSSPFSAEDMREQIAAHKAAAEKAKKDGEDETARVAANNKAAEDDKALAKTLQSELDKAFADIEDIFKGDAYKTLGKKIGGLADEVEKALKQVEKAGTYTSPIDAEAIRAEIKAASEAAAETGKAAIAANNDALKTIDGLTSELQEAVEDIARTCPDVKDNDDITAMQDDIEAQIAQLLKDVNDAYGTLDYTSTLAPAEGIKEAIAKMGEAAKAAQQEHDDIATAIAGVETMPAGLQIYTVDGKRVNAPVKGEVNIFRLGNTSVKRLIK